MASFNDAWIGSPEQVALVSNVTGDTFSPENWISGPGNFQANQASNNYWLNSYGQSAALFWANVRSFGQAEALNMWKAEQKSNAPIPSVILTQGKAITPTAPPPSPPPPAQQTTQLSTSPNTSQLPSGNGGQFANTGMSSSTLLLLIGGVAILLLLMEK